MHAQYVLKQKKPVFSQVNCLNQIEKVKVMEDTKRKNEQLHSLLNEIQFLKQHTQVQEEQVAELKQKLEGVDFYK